MRIRQVAVTFALAVGSAIALPGVAFGGDVTLHPNGFGTETYSSWKAQEGQPGQDSRGNKDQALYFQKMTSTATFAAAVARFNNVAGMHTSELDPLGFDFRTDGHCGAGAPRYNLTFIPDAGGPEQTLFFGCNSGMLPREDMGTPDGNWDGRETAGPLPGGTVVSLLIVYDEGIEFPPPFVFLDNIQVGNRVWTSATDNGQADSTAP